MGETSKTAPAAKKHKTLIRGTDVWEKYREGSQFQGPGMEGLSTPSTWAIDQHVTAENGNTVAISLMEDVG